MKRQIVTAVFVGSSPFILSFYAARWHQSNYPCGTPTGSFAELVGWIGWPAARFQNHLATSRFEAAIRSLDGDFESTPSDGRVVQFSLRSASRAHLTTNRAEEVRRGAAMNPQIESEPCAPADAH